VNGYIDFHAHILPQADHGSDSLETSLTQLAAAEKAGIGLIAATSHYYPDRPHSDSFFQRRQHAAQQLRAAYHGPIEIRLGAEVFLCEGMQNHPRLHELAIEGTDDILIEMPSGGGWPQRLLDSLYAIGDEGLTVILAHVERYPAHDVDELLSSGLWGQVNVGSMIPMLKRLRLQKLLDRGQVVAFGSDVHGAGSTAYDDYRTVMEQQGRRGQDVQQRMRRLIGVD